MLSIIITLKNRASLLNYGLASLAEQHFCHSHSTEINIGDGGSTDELDQVLQKWSGRFPVIRKYRLDRSKSGLRHASNCPAWEINRLVWLSNYPVILKMDPEIVLMDRAFVGTAISTIQRSPRIVMPQPWHMRDDGWFESLEEIKAGWRSHVQETHITREPDRVVYYAAVFNRRDFLDLGGVEERFVEGIGSEDEHFLDQWRNYYGWETVINCGSPAIHLYHGPECFSLPDEKMPLVKKNVVLRSALSWALPNRCRSSNRLRGTVREPQISRQPTS